MMLEKTDIDELVATVETELKEMTMYPNIGQSKVQAIKVGDFTLDVVVTHDDYEEDE
ncbi:MAG: hypothetical protein R3230_00705 [Nitrosopumilaceae archaeon]|nr:hypothetical protein [Nitrosopumilaceae archaeon]